jgi:mannose-6-phosphate isomerase-like protein (cupin superfamily)
MSETAKYLSPGQGTSYRVLGGDVVTIKVTGADSAGAFTMIETVTPPDAGPPLHRHMREEETFFVLEGSFVFHVGDRRIMAGQGSLLVAPRGVPHRFVNVGSSPGRLLVIIRPGGFENFIREIATLPLNEPPDPAKMKAIGDAHGLEFL